MDILNFYKGKSVLVTGHTGFKGAWLCKMLTLAGAKVTGYALNPPTFPSLFEIAEIKQDITSIIGDIRDISSLKKVFEFVQPEFVFHLAAQPIVRDSYKDPVYTYETNVMGTVNILECVRSSNSVKSFLNVTTDKVYLNKEWVWGYRENEELDGYDPYSNSKSCSELVTHSYKNSFFNDDKVAISTARAGNVIGGGDFANDRIIPDCVKAAIEKHDIIVRKWGDGIKWVNQYDGGPHEANFLKLDCSKLKATFNWTPRWNLDTAIAKVIEWSKCWIEHKDIRTCMDNEINEFLLCKK